MINIASKIVKDWIDKNTWDDEGGESVLSVEQLDEAKEVIVISIERYRELDNDQDFLNALKAAGVDNWEGYGFAQDIHSGEA